MSKKMLVFAALVGLLVLLVACGQVAAQGGSVCDQDPYCLKFDAPGNTGEKTAPGPIERFVIKAGNAEHTFFPPSGDNGCYSVVFSNSNQTVSWSKYGSGPTCKDVSHVQLWWQPEVESTAVPTETPSTPAQKVSPIVECVDNNGDGTFTAHFGYNNPNSYTLEIQVGANNKFNPAPLDRGQPSQFQSGRIRDAFQVVFDGSNLVWFLRTQNGPSGTATASKNSPACPTPTPEPTEVPTLTPVPLQKLRLTSLCWVDSSTHQMMVRNSNAVEVPFTWDVYGQGQSGNGVAPAGESTFTVTGNIGMAMTVRLFVDGKQNDVKAVNQTPCVAVTEVPTEEPTEIPTEEPTEEPTIVPTDDPVTPDPTGEPTGEPTVVPTVTLIPTNVPPTATPTQGDPGEPFRGCRIVLGESWAWALGLPTYPYYISNDGQYTDVFGGAPIDAIKRHEGVVVAELAFENLVSERIGLHIGAPMGESFHLVLDSCRVPEDEQPTPQATAVPSCPSCPPARCENVNATFQYWDSGVGKYMWMAVMDTPYLGTDGTPIYNGEWTIVVRASGSVAGLPVDGVACSICTEAWGVTSDGSVFFGFSATVWDTAVAIARHDGHEWPLPSHLEAARRVRAAWEQSRKPFGFFSYQ